MLHEQNLTNIFFLSKFKIHLISPKNNNTAGFFSVCFLCIFTLFETQFKTVQLYIFVINLPSDIQDKESNLYQILCGNCENSRNTCTADSPEIIKQNFIKFIPSREDIKNKRFDF